MDMVDNNGNYTEDFLKAWEKIAKTKDYYEENTDDDND